MDKGATTAPILLRLYGLGPVPSFKNAKRAVAWVDAAKKIVKFFEGQLWVRKDSIHVTARPMTEPEVKQWMESAILSFESQLRSALQITDATIRTVAQPRSLIASHVPLDDSWTWCPEVIIRSEKCEPGHEGAEILIERIS